MAKEYTAICKDCGAEFGYSHSSYELSRSRGLSRPERCPKCRQLHGREISLLGLSYYDLQPVRPIDPERGIQPGILGALEHPPRVHRVEEKEANFNLSEFGITDDDIRAVFDLLDKHQVLVVEGPTGSGKSTFLPYRLMVPPPGIEPVRFTQHGQIVVTQPRIQATIGIPRFVARRLHGSSLGPGYDVGFRYSGEHATDWRNKLVYITDGTLVNWIVSGEIGRLGLIMIDEAHERSVNIDLILGLMKAQLPRYPHLKFIIASATIDAEKFVAYYGDVPLESVREQVAAGRSLAEVADGIGVGYRKFHEKRRYDVDVRFRGKKPIPPEQWTGQSPTLVAEKAFEILQAMEAAEEPAGDILAFLHGQRPIEQACKRLRELVEEHDVLVNKVDVFPLYTKLPAEEQEKALRKNKDPDRYRVVISTNVAETSLTVPGIVHVVDSGLINEPRWDPTTETLMVVPTIHSRAGCRQRWGRAGRERDGVAHSLFTEEQFRDDVIFPEYTLPEIKRAPIEQIVLTAKAAGVDDVQNFDWLERPSADELERAPEVLKQRGALDEEGDLTEHGLELQWFADEPNIANLMVLADRFACAVEMATLLAMLKSGGRRRLLKWDRGWDAYTKRAVHQIHRGLIGPAQDDVEFYLKLYEAWAGDPDDEDHDSAEWARANYVSHSALGRVKRERDKLLQPISGRKKYDERRRINFDLLTRLRLVFMYGLSDRIYLLADQQDSPLAAHFGTPAYRPYRSRALDDGRQDDTDPNVIVQVDPESICSEYPVEAFACARKRAVRRRLSPHMEPVTVIYASVLTLIKPEWLSCVGQSVWSLARLISRETRAEDGSLLQSTNRPRLFLDQAYPVGSVFACRQVDSRASDGSPLVLLEEQLAAPRPVIEAYRDEEMEDTVEEEELEAETELEPDVDVEEVEADVDEEDERFWTVDEELEEEATWLSLIGDEADEAIDEPATSSLTLSDEAGNIIQAKGRLRLADDQRVPAEDRFAVRVAGFDFSDLNHPTVEVRLPPRQDPFEKFVAAFEVGDEIEVVVRKIEDYPDDYLLFAVVEEPTTGFEILMEPEDVSLVGRNFAVEALAPGESFPVIIEDIDASRRRVRITRLKFAEEDFLKVLGRQRERTLDARIAEVHEYGVFVHLEPERNKWETIQGTYVYLDYMPPNPEQTMLGRQCRVRIREDRGQYRRQLPTIPGGLEELLEGRQWGDHITGNLETRVLTVDGRMTYHDRVMLLAQSEDTGYRRAINWLFRRSNGWRTEIIDMQALEDLAIAQQKDERHTGKVVKLLPGVGAIVQAESGFTGLIRPEEIGYGYGSSIRDLQEGTEVEFRVKEVDLEGGKAEFSLKLPERSPYAKYHPGMEVQGTIRKIQPHQVLVALDQGGIGSISLKELAWEYINHPSDVVSVGEHVEAQVLSVDEAEEEVHLSRRAVEDPWLDYEEGMKVSARITGVEDYGAFAEIEPGVSGLIHISKLGWTRVMRVEDVVQPDDEITVLIIDKDDDQRKMGLSCRLEETRPPTRFPVDTWHEGIVVSVQNFGAFVEIARGVTGLIPLSELSYNWVGQPDDVVAEGQRVRVRIIDIALEENTYKIALSLKDPEQNPYTRYHSGMEVEGTICEMGSYGVLVSLDWGGVGSILLKELAWERVNHPRDVVSLGERVKAEVLAVNAAKEGVQLSRKALEPDPLDHYQVGMTVQGTVVGLEKYGAFVELEPGVQGLLHNSEMSWSDYVERPEDRLHLRDWVTVRVIDLNRQKRNIGLSLKRAYRVTTTIPSDKIGLVIGPGGETIKSLQSRHDAGVEIDEDGTITIQAADQSRIRAVRREIEDLVRTHRDTITIPQEKIGQLIGKGGATIKRLMRETGAHIEVNDSGLVTIESRNAWEVDEAKRKILETVPTVQATLTIPAGKVGKLIGRGGSTIRQLQRDTDTDISVEDRTVTKQGLIFTSSEDVGEVTIWGTSQAKVNAAINAIQRIIPEAR